MCTDADVHIQLHTRVVQTIIEKGCIRGVITESKSGRQAWFAEAFVDATVDGDLGALAGCGFDMGSKDDELQPMTLKAFVTIDSVENIKEFISFYGGDGPRTSCWKTMLVELKRAGLTPSYGKPTLFQAKGNLMALMVNHEYGISAIDAA